MNPDATNLQGLVDIEPPLTPLFFSLGYAVQNATLSSVLPALLITALLLVTAFTLWTRYGSVKGRARRSLHRLQKQFRRRSISQREAACELSRVLRDTFDLHQPLTRTILPPALKVHAPRWQHFTEQLSVSCYAAPQQQPAAEQMSQLLDDAYFWLRAWPNRQHDRRH
ncbi:MAG: hypothetical protein RRB22_11490 [Gammaproteobacteria bacterium]|nr:hypothetical protein [Gammaproteobacteria bacterium]